MTPSEEALEYLWDRPRWYSHAACRTMDTNLFFPTREGAGRPSRPYTWQTTQALQICGGCPVREECLEFGLNENFGIWGGMSDRQRRRERARRAAAQ